MKRKNQIALSPEFVYLLHAIAAKINRITMIVSDVIRLVSMDAKC